MEDGGAKYTCPSRKSPCKHGLALMLMCAHNDADFTPAAIPDWVTEWLVRRRKTAAPTSTPELGEPKAGNIATPQPRAEPKPADPETEAKRRAAAEKRAQETRQTVHAATEELESWIADQLAAFPAFLADLSTRCRRIAARLVDGKAAALASRIDEMPSRLLPLLPHERIDAAIAELGQLVLLVRAWRAHPTDAELKREIIAAETRDELLADPRRKAHHRLLGGPGRARCHAPRWPRERLNLVDEPGRDRAPFRPIAGFLPGLGGPPRRRLRRR